MKQKYKYVMQTDSSDCGIACIRTILLFYGINTTKEEILDKVNKNNFGITAYDLINVANTYNLNAYGIKTDIENIKKLPAIAHTIKNNNMFHFIVIYEIDKIKKTMKVMDPDQGVIDLSFSSFKQMSTNIFLMFNGNKRKLKNYSLKNEIKKILKENKLFVIKTFLISVLSVLLSLIFNYYVKLLLIKNDISYLLTVFSIYIIITLFKNTTSLIKNKLTLSFNVIIDKELNSRLSNHIFSLSYKYFMSKTTGEFFTLSEDIDIFKQIITNVVIVSLIDIVMLVIISIYLSFLSFVSFFLLFIFSLVMILLINRYKYMLNDNFIKLKRSKIKYSSLFIEYLKSFETIKNLNLFTKIVNLLYFNYDKKLKYEQTYIKKEYKYSFISNLLNDFAYIFCLFILAILVYKNIKSFYDIILFSSMFYLFNSFLNEICQNIYLYKIYETSVNRVLDLLKQKPENYIKSNLYKVHKIEFKNASLKLGNKKVFSNIDLSFFKNDKVYIYGVSGIGKSTLIKTLLKYYDLTSGNILIDNVNLKDLSLSYIKENITYIGQNETLFKGSIKDNLDFVSFDSLKQDNALKTTLFDRVMIKNNISKNYFLEENANNLSGGEKKKLILARGILHFKEVLILDELFNEISVEEERQILKNIFSLYKNKIIIVISHRNNNIDLFNKKIEIGDDGAYEII